MGEKGKFEYIRTRHAFVMSVVIEINPFLLFWKLLFKCVIRCKAMVTNLTIIIAIVIVVIIVVIVN